MGSVNYSFVTISAESLNEMLAWINSDQDKIIAVTQNADLYTIFYEREGNVKDGDNDG